MSEQAIGRYVGHEFVMSTRGTPGIELLFDLTDGSERRVPVRLYFPPDSDTACEISRRQMEACGWNGEWGGECAFDPAIDVPLYVEDGRERTDRPGEFWPAKWRISTRRAWDSSAPIAPHLAELSRRYKAEHPPALGAAAKPAPKPVVKSAPPPPPSSKPSTPCTNADEAWALAERAGVKAEMFWPTVRETIGRDDVSSLTPEEWRRVGERLLDPELPPF